MSLVLSVHEITSGREHLDSNTLSTKCHRLHVLHFIKRGLGWFSVFSANRTVVTLYFYEVISKNRRIYIVLHLSRSEIQDARLAFSIICADVETVVHWEVQLHGEEPHGIASAHYDHPR